LVRSVLFIVENFAQVPWEFQRHAELIINKIRQLEDERGSIAGTFVWMVRTPASSMNGFQLTYRCLHPGGQRKFDLPACTGDNSQRAA
jgi:hypothetical protein